MSDNIRICVCVMFLCIFVVHSCSRFCRDVDIDAFYNILCIFSLIVCLECQVSDNIVVMKKYFCGYIFLHKFVFVG